MNTFTLLLVEFNPSSRFLHDLLRLKTLLLVKLKNNNDDFIIYGFRI